MAGGDAQGWHRAAGVLAEHRDGHETREHPSGGFEGLGLVICLVFSVLGGYVCWREVMVWVSGREAERAAERGGKCNGALNSFFFRGW